MFVAPQSRPTLLARLTALAAVLLVLALTVLAASPELHAQVHAHEAAGAAHPDVDADGGCVITLFAQGILAVLAFFGLVFHGRRASPLVFAGVDRVPAAGPDYRFLPTQAPPAA